MISQKRLFSTFCISSGVLLAAAVAFALLQFGAAVEPEQVTWLSIACIIGAALLTQIGFFIAPSANKYPRPRGYLVLLGCVPWLIFFGSAVSHIAASNQASRIAFAVTLYGAISNAIALFVIGNRLFQSRCEAEESNKI
jgi:hypothetical protein